MEFGGYYVFQSLSIYCSTVVPSSSNPLYLLHLTLSHYFTFTSMCSMCSMCFNPSYPFNPSLYLQITTLIQLTGSLAPLTISAPSGGQASRMCLARALYGACTEGGFLLLDDVLGSLDAATRKKVWSGVVKLQREYGFGVVAVGAGDGRGPVINVEKGAVAWSSTKPAAATAEEEEMVVVKKQVAAAVETVAVTTVPGENPLAPSDAVTPALTATKPSPSQSNTHNSPSAKSPTPLVNTSPNATAFASSEDSSEADPNSEKAASLALRTPAPPLSSYLAYFLRSKSPLLIAATLLSYSSSSLFTVAQQSSIAAMSSPNFTRNLMTATFMIAVSQFARTLLTVTTGLRASRNLFQNMQQTLASRPLSFFYETTPGSILTRFTSDLNTATTQVRERERHCCLLYIVCIFVVYCLYIVCCILYCRLPQECCKSFRGSSRLATPDLVFFSISLFLFSTLTKVLPFLPSFCSSPKPSCGASCAGLPS